MKFLFSHFWNPYLLSLYIGVDTRRVFLCFKWEAISFHWQKNVPTLVHLHLSLINTRSLTGETLDNSLAAHRSISNSVSSNPRRLSLKMLSVTISASPWTYWAVRSVAIFSVIQQFWLLNYTAQNDSTLQMPSRSKLFKARRVRSPLMLPTFYLLPVSGWCGKRQ